MQDPPMGKPMIVDIDPDPGSKRFRELIEQVESGTYMLTNSRGDRFRVLKYDHADKMATVLRMGSATKSRLTYGFIHEQMTPAYYVDPDQQTLHQWDSSYMQL
jgi:hypothetical protein